MLKKFWNWLSPRERFMTFETAKGFYFLPAGLYGLWMLEYNFQDSYKLLLQIVFGFLVFEGVRKILVNRIKQAYKREHLIEERIVKEEGEGINVT